MEEITANSFAHFIEIIEKNDFAQTIYRGEPVNDTPLVPKLGRVAADKKATVKELEQKLFGGFIARAHRYLEFEPRSKCDWLAVAQHFGLPTRLLDWTESPLVAAFFAARKPGDGFVYSTHSVKHVDPDKFDPFDLKDAGLVRLPPRFDRIHHQLGLFSISPDPTASFDYGHMRRIQIPANLRGMFLDVLCKSGVTDESLFPGLDGLSRYLTWSRGYED